MKSFRQGKPNKKGKRKSKAAAQTTALQPRSETKTIPWVPPYPIIPKLPSIEEGFPLKPLATYQMPNTADEVDELIQPEQHSEQKDICYREDNMRKEFLKTFRSLTGRWRSWDIWTDFITMAACTISNSVDRLHFDEREKLYLETIKKYNKKEQNLFPKLFAYLVEALEKNPDQDFLGSIYSELGLNSKEHQQIFTPYKISYLMAEITISDIADRVKEKGVVEIHDCCCGAGSTLIAASNVAKRKLEKAGLNYQNHILVTGQDIDRLVTMMCYIQLSLLGMAGYFKVGDALIEPMAEKDSLDDYWFTPMYFFPIWYDRRVWKSISKLFEKGG